uniref:Uncharacterized protein n=1 Tax=Haptolina ericina TaxID=156174 RepID=A0A7S3B7H9_9EUKA
MPVCFAARVAQASEEGEEQYRGKPGFDAEGRIIQSGTAAAYKAELAREAKRAIAEAEKVERLATLNAARAELRSKRSQEDRFWEDFLSPQQIKASLETESAEVDRAEALQAKVAQAKAERLAKQAAGGGAP